MGKASHGKLVAICWMFLGCNHIRIAEFDNRTRTVTVAGGKLASQSGLDEKAQEFCGQSKALLLGCGEGSRSTAMVMDNRGNWATGVSNPHDAYRCTYQCQ